MAVEILDLIAKPNDVLEIRFADGTTERRPVAWDDGGAPTDWVEIPVVRTATGWRSAITNHAVGTGKNRTYRAMTADEACAYALACVAEQFPDLAPEAPKEPATVPFARTAEADAVLAEIADKRALLEAAQRDRTAAPIGKDTA